MEKGLVNKAIIGLFKKTISNLVDQGVWCSKEGVKIKISLMSDTHLLFSHRFLVNEIDNLGALENFSFDDDNDELFKLSILAMEGINVFLKEIKFRKLTPLPSEAEISISHNEVLKSENELSFKFRYINSLKFEVRKKWHKKSLN